MVSFSKSLFDFLRFSFYSFVYLINSNLLQCAAHQYEYVTCGSVIKLANNYYQNVRLHSHDIKYGSGSGQQSVTGLQDTSDDHNSHWQILGEQKNHCQRGNPIKCGQKIRLLHVASKHNLHSHLFKSPLSGNQEVSCFGENGKGDTGDHWQLVCSGTYWERSEGILLKHIDTSMYLHLSNQVYGRPIHGQREICAVSSPRSESYWTANEGVYIKPSEQSQKKSHDEL